MEFIRWYDKNEQLKVIIETLEQIDTKVKTALAHEIIQTVINSKHPYTDDFIHEVSNDFVPANRRWYDKSDVVHSAVEMLKLIDTTKEQELLDEILSCVLSFCDEQCLIRFGEKAHNEDFFGD